MKFPASSCSHLFLLLTLSQALHAGEPTSAVPSTPLTLDAAAQRALTQSPAVRISEAEIDRREGTREQASGAFDWIVTAGASRIRERTPYVDGLGRDAVAASNTTAYSVGAAHRLRNGIVVQPSVDVAIPEHESPASPTLGASQLNLQIVVPLLRGLGQDSSGAAEAAARGDVEVARLLYRHTLAAQVFATAQAYWFARAAEAALDVRRDDEERARRLHEGIRVLVDTRMFPPSFMLQSEANLRQKSTSRQDAEITALDARFELSRTMGLGADGIAAATLPSDPLPAAAIASEADRDQEARLRWVTRALNQRADYLALRQSEVPLQILTRQAELDLKPRVDLGVRAGYAGLSRNDHLLTPLSRRLTGANGEVNVALEWPVTNTYQKGLLRERRASRRQAELQTAQAQSDVAAQVCSALAAVRLRAGMMENATATTHIARQAVDQEQQKLKAGESSVLDVINLENLLSSARLAEIDAQAGYAIAVARLRFAVGEIFTAEQADHSFQLTNLAVPPDEK